MSQLVCALEAQWNGRCFLSFECWVPDLASMLSGWGAGGERSCYITGSCSHDPPPLPISFSFEQPSLVAAVHVITSL